MPREGVHHRHAGHGNRYPRQLGRWLERQRNRRRTTHRFPRKRWKASLLYANEAKYRSELGGIYGVAEAVRYLKAAPHAETLYPVSSRTLRGWVRQRCVKDDGGEFPVAFDDLIAMRVIAVLRSAGVGRREVSDSESLMQEETGVRHPMATETLWAGEGEPFFKWRQYLVNSGNRAQSALTLVQEYLIPARDLVFDETSGQAVSWEPQPGIVLDPLVQFRRPLHQSHSHTHWRDLRDD